MSTLPTPLVYVDNQGNPGLAVTEGQAEATKAAVDKFDAILRELSADYEQDEAVRKWIPIVRQGRAARLDVNLKDWSQRLLAAAKEYQRLTHEIDVREGWTGQHSFGDKAVAQVTEMMKNLPTIDNSLPTRRECIAQRKEVVNKNKAAIDDASELPVKIDNEETSLLHKLNHIVSSGCLDNGVNTFSLPVLGDIGMKQKIGPFMTPTTSKLTGTLNLIDSDNGWILAD